MTRGFVPIRHKTGGTIRPVSYPMASNVTIFKGDLVVTNATGDVQAAAAGANTSILGVAAEYKVNPAGGTNQILIFDDPDIIYAVRSSGAVTAADRFLNAPGAVGAGGNPVTGLSSHVLNAGAMAVTATLALKILGKVDAPGNDWGAVLDLEVCLNSTVMTPAVVGV